MLHNFIVSYLLYRLTYCRTLLVIIIKSNYIIFNNILEKLENFSKFYQKLREEFHSSEEQYFVLEQNKDEFGGTFLKVAYVDKSKRQKLNQVHFIDLS